MRGLKAGKHIFVEKPLCLSETELEAITSDVDTVISNLEAAKRESQRSNDNLDLYDGMDDDDCLEGGDNLV